MGNEKMASYRYRCKIPAQELGAKINAPADTMVFCKPQPVEVSALNDSNKRIIADFCDDHFSQHHYQQFAMLSDGITCPTEKMAEIIRKNFGRTAEVVPDPYEYPLEAPHCHGTKLLWYGHSVNAGSLKVHQYLPNLRVVSNFHGAIPWSYETMLEEFKRADIVIMPATAPYKSPNRTVEAIRQGCFVVAEPHPSLEGFPIYIGNIKEGIEWAKNHPHEANKMTLAAQDYITRFSPEQVANAWRKALTVFGCT